MTRKKFLSNSLLIFLGVNFANLASYLLYILLLKYDKDLYNDYVPISSIIAILFVVSLIIFRAFAVGADVMYNNLTQQIIHHRKALVSLLPIGILLTLVLAFVLSQVQDKYSFVALLLTIYTAIASYVYSMYRGIRQYDNDLLNMIIGINIETFIRLLIGFSLGYFLNLGIEGILFSMILGHVIGIIYMYKAPKATTGSQQVSREFYQIFINSFVFTLGLELFANFLVLFANSKLIADNQTLTNFNALEFFRKTVMLSIIAISGYIISTSSRRTYSKKFIFAFLLISGTVVSGSVISLFYIFKQQLSDFINLDLNLIDQNYINLFFLGTMLSAVAYLISSWLFAFQKQVYIYLPILLSLTQAIALIVFGDNLQTIIVTFTIVSGIFLAMYLGLSAWELRSPDEVEVDSIGDTPTVIA